MTSRRAEDLNKIVDGSKTSNLFGKLRHNSIDQTVKNGSMSHRNNNHEQSMKQIISVSQIR